MGSLEEIKQKIGFIGGGNMGKAICQGMLRKGFIHALKIFMFFK